MPLLPTLESNVVPTTATCEPPLAEMPPPRPLFITPNAVFFVKVELFTVSTAVSETAIPPPPERCSQKKEGGRVVGTNGQNQHVHGLVIYQRHRPKLTGFAKQAVRQALDVTRTGSRQVIDRQQTGNTFRHKETSSGPFSHLHPEMVTLVMDVTLRSSAIRAPPDVVALQSSITESVTTRWVSWPKCAAPNETTEREEEVRVTRTINTVKTNNNNNNNNNIISIIFIVTQRRHPT